MPDDRLDVIKPWTILFAAYLGGILTSWYTKPFPAPTTSRAERVRFGLALASTLVFNLALLFLIAQTYVLPREQVHDVLSDVAMAVTLAKFLSFIVAPANLYYFGLKTPE